jgi:acyl-lipid omega-6 desaturase (Delta-12 desaturase)
MRRCRPWENGRLRAFVSRKFADRYVHPTHGKSCQTFLTLSKTIDATSSIHLIKQEKRVMLQRYIKSDNVKAWTQVLTTILPLALLWWAVPVSVEISYWLTAAVTVLMSLFCLRVFVLMHECGHGSLFRTQQLNRGVGFFLGVLAAMPQYVWSQHHDYHHATNGNWEKYRGPLTTPSVDEYAAMTPAQQRMYRYTRNIGMAPFGGFFYLIFNPRFTWIKGSIEFLIHILKSKIAQPSVSLKAHASAFQTRYWKNSKEYWHMFWNNLVLLSAWGLMCWVMGPTLFFTIYIISLSLAGGAGIVLFSVQHNFEHSHATDTKDWDYDTSAIEGTSFLIFPAWLNWFTANIAYHHVHHLSSKIPNYCLVACHNEYAHLFSEVTRVKLSEVYKASKYILWDAHAQRIISVAEFNQQQANKLAPVSVP